MKYVRHNFIGNYSNFSGQKEKQSLVEDEFAKTIALYPDLVADLLTSNGVQVESEEPSKLLALVENNSDNKKMVYDLAKLVMLLNAKDEKGKMYLNQAMKSFSNANGVSLGFGRFGNPSKNSSPSSSGVQAPNKSGKGKEILGKAADWFGKNTDLLNNVAGGLMAGINASKLAKKNKGKSSLSSSVDTYTKPDNPDIAPPNRTALYIGLGALALLIIGGGVFLYLRKNSGGAPMAAPATV
jgi:hypothetical protein